MRIYIASHDRWAGLFIADLLKNEGHEITSQWLYKEFKPTNAKEASS